MVFLVRCGSGDRRALDAHEICHHAAARIWQFNDSASDTASIVQIVTVLPCQQTCVANATTDDSGRDRAADEHHSRGRAKPLKCR